MRGFSNFAVVATAIVFIASSASAQKERVRRPAVSKATLALYEPGEFKGVKFRLMKPIDITRKRER